LFISRTAATLDKAHKAAIEGSKKSIGHLEILIEKIIKEVEAIFSQSPAI